MNKTRHRKQRARRKPKPTLLDTLIANMIVRGEYFFHPPTYRQRGGAVPSDTPDWTPAWAPQLPPRPQYTIGVVESGEYTIGDGSAQAQRKPVPCPSHPGTQCHDRGYCGDDCVQDFFRPIKNR